jgi:Protein of unknown function (DUF3830)
MTRLEISIGDARAVARLYDEYTPKTIEALRSSLPYTGPGIHAIRAGREVFTLIPAPVTDPGAENQSVFPAPGDLYLFHQHEGYRPMDVPKRFRADQTTTEYWHIAIWYGRDSLPMSPTGLYPANHFGEVVDGLPELAEACESIRFDGVRDVMYRILEDGA